MASASEKVNDYEYSGRKVLVVDGTGVALEGGGEPQTTGTFIQKEALDSATAEHAITLTRGTNWSIKEIRFYYSGATAGDYIQVFRKGSATTANERNDAHADSRNVLYGEGYLTNGDLILNANDLSETGLRVYLSAAAGTGTVYVNIKYTYT